MNLTEWQDTMREAIEHHDGDLDAAAGDAAGALLADPEGSTAIIVRLVRRSLGDLVRRDSQTAISKMGGLTPKLPVVAVAEPPGSGPAKKQPRRLSPRKTSAVEAWLNTPVAVGPGQAKPWRDVTTTDLDWMIDQRREVAVKNTRQADELVGLRDSLKKARKERVGDLRWQSVPDAAKAVTA